MRRLLILLAFTASAAAEPAERAQLCIERGLLHQRTLHDRAQAAALYRSALRAPDATPRTSAEALWHMAANYSTRGSDRTGLLLLTKLQQDCPGVEPFARLAAAESIGISTEDIEVSNPRAGANIIDRIAAQDTLRLLEAAVKLKAAPAISAFTRRLRWHCDAMVFELSLAETTEPAREKRIREQQLASAEDWLEWAQHGETPALDDPVAAQIKDRSFLEDDPMLTRIFEARDAFTSALGNADASAASKAKEALQALVAPITQGPDDLLLVLAFRGELAGMSRAIALLEKNQPADALLAWEEARRTFHESGVGNSGFRLQEMESLPESLLPEIMGSLTFLELAITEIINYGEDGHGDALKALDTATVRLTACAEKCTEPKGSTRLGKMIRRLRDAADKLEHGDTDTADELMRTELYISP